MSSPRAPLSRQRVAGAALTFIDEHGQAALSMRKLGADLGVEAMSLYNHVTSKDDLLDAVGDLLYNEVLSEFQTDPEWSWQQDLGELAHQYRAVAHRHPNALSLMTDRVIPSTVKYAFLEKCYSIFTKAGFETKAAALAFDTSASWVVGAVRQEIGLMVGLAAAEGAATTAAASSEHQTVDDFLSACLAWAPRQRFDFGLETVLSGLEVQLSRA